MMERSFATDFEKVFLGLGSFVLVVASLALAQKVLIPVALAILFAFVLMPLVQELQRRGVPRTLASILIVCLALTLIVILGWVVTAQLQSLVSELPQYKATITEKFANLRTNNIVQRLTQMFGEIHDAILPDEGAATDQPNKSPIPVTNVDIPFLPVVTNVAVPVFEGLASALFVCVMVIFMLIMREDLRDRLIRLIGHSSITSTTRAIDDAAHRISRFLLTLSIINVLFGIAFAIGLSLIGVPYAMLWGLLAGCLRFVPYLGIWIGILMPLTYSIAIFEGWSEPLLIIALCAALELAVANFVEPVLLGHSTGIAPFALLVAAAFWAWLWGPIGLVLSAPLTTCLVVLGKHVPQLEFLDVMLGDNRVLQTSVSFYQRLLARDQDEAIELVDEYLKSHANENVYDEVLIPVLLVAKSDRERGVLSEQDEAYILRAIDDLVEDLPSPYAKSETDAAADGRVAMERGAIGLLACPAQDRTDEVALRMLRKLLEPSGCRLEVLTCKTLSAEVVSAVDDQTPALLCIAALPPGGLTQTRYLCKRLSARHEETKILIGRWGDREDLDIVRRRLQGACADYIAGTLLETRRHILSLLPAMTWTSNGAQKPAHVAK